jgi:hypothetical protein
MEILKAMVPIGDFKVLESVVKDIETGKVKPGHMVKNLSDDCETVKHWESNLPTRRTMGMYLK